MALLISGDYRETIYQSNCCHACPHLAAPANHSTGQQTSIHLVSQWAALSLFSPSPPLWDPSYCQASSANQGFQLHFQVALEWVHEWLSATSVFSLSQVTARIKCSRVSLTLFNRNGEWGDFCMDLGVTDILASVIHTNGLRQLE